MNQFMDILFDLDGTITDSYPGITAGVRYSLEQLGIIEEDIANLKRFVGPPLHEIYAKYYGIVGEDYVKALDFFHAYYRSQGIFECTVFAGVEEMLRRLLANGKRLYLATSKPEPEAKRVMDHFDLSKYFTFIGGSDGDLGTSRDTKAKVIAYVMERNHLSKESCIMVGDKSYDIVGAKTVGISSVGVLYGYGSVHEFIESGADFICRDLDELEELLLLGRVKDTGMIEEVQHDGTDA